MGVDLSATTKSYILLTNPKDGIKASNLLPTASSASRIAVLAVDDHPANLVALNALLSEFGFDSALANSGSEAIKRLSEGHFACVLLDVRMPGIDGFETAALIRKREQWKDLPIIFMTSSEPTLADFTQGYSLGAVDFVTRPLASEILKGKLKAITQLHLDRERARCERDAALRDNQQHLGPLLETLPIGVWATDENLVVTICSGGLYGQGDVPPADTFIGRPLSEILRSTSEEQMHPALAAHLQALKGHTVKYEDETAGRAFEGHVRPLKDDSGRIRGVLGAAVDITERRKAQEQLSAARAELAHVTDAVPSLISFIDKDCKYVFVNKAYQDWFGKPAEYFRGRHAQEVLGGAAFAKLRPHFEEALSGKRVSFEAQVPYKDGPSRYVSATYVPHLLPDGSVTGFVALVNDLTNTELSSLVRQRTRDLEDTRGRYDMLSRVSPVGLFQTDAKGDCTDVNDRWADITGLDSAQAKGRGWTSALHPEDRDRVIQEWYDAAQTRRDFRSEYRFLRPDGGITWVIGQATELLDGAKSLIGYVGTITDITERKAKEDEVRLAGAKLESANQDLEAFVSSVSHDLRTPLRGMSGMAQLLLESYSGRILDAEGQGYANRIVELSGRLDQMTRDLLEYSRISRAEMRLESIDLISVFKDSLVTMEAEVATRKAKVEWSGLSDHVVGNQVLIQQVFGNLLSNAIKFVGPSVEPRVRITGSTQGEFVRVCVEDNGIGILPENRPKLFRLFERIHSQKEYPGTGVGLALVKRAVERMGGRVGVDCSQTGGSSFWFELRRSK